MAERQLVVVVEGTAALGPYWHIVVSDYLEKIIRCFCGNELNGQKLPGANPELALVVFNSHGPYNDFLVQRSGWTKDLDVFLWWLSKIPFSGGGFGDVAIAEGLSDALMIFPALTNASQSLQNLDSQKHCILIAASNPYPLPTPIYSPPNLKTEQSENAEAQTETCLGDAEAVAKLFCQCFVSLSVICPRQLPKLKAIYNAGKRNPRSVDPTVDNLKNPNFTVFLSESFMEARAALSHPLIGNMTTNQGMVKLDAAAPSAVTGSASSSIPPVNGSLINRQQPSLGNIPPAVVKVEPTTMPTIVSGYSHLPSISSVSTQVVPSLQTSSSSPTSQEMNVITEAIQEHKPFVNSMPQQLRPVGPAPANINILNNLSQHRQVMNSASIQTIGGTPMAMHMSNMISSGMISSGMPGIASVTGSGGALMTTAQVAQNTGLGSFSSANSHVSGNSNMGISPALTNLQNSLNMGQSVSGMVQGSLTQGSQSGQGGINMTPSTMNSLGPTVMSSAPGTMIPTPGMSQQPGVNSLGMTNSTAVNMSLTQQPSSNQQPQSKYVKIWEGALSGQRQGQPVFICKLEGYRNATASESLADDWPSSMQIVRLIAQDHMSNKQYVGRADFLVFRTLNQHGFLGQLQEKKLCAVIQLASQTLLLSVSDKAGRLIGMLFPGDMVVFKPQVSSQQQQQLQQQQQQLQQQLQLQQPQQSQQNQHLQQQQLQAQQQQQQQAMAGNGMNQTFIQGSGRSQMMAQGKLPSSNMSNGGGFMP